MFDLAEKSKFKPSRMALQPHLKLIAASHRPLAIGLKHRDGRWLSVISGWYHSGAGVLFFQCNNDFDFGQASWSTVLRGFLIESLIRQA